MPAEKGSECVQVVVRARPMNSTEKSENCTSVLEIDIKSNQIFIKDPASKETSKGFTFDAVYNESTVQKNFYDESCSIIIESVLEGFNGTIFAYGQTGCGKSFTMQGKDEPPELRGVIPNAINHIFEFVNATNDSGHEFLVRCSYLEIYNEELLDLLSDPRNPPKCEIKEDVTKGVFVKNLSDVIVRNEKEMMDLLERGQKSRHVASTLMNSESSRSHSIFTLVVEMSSKDDTGKDHLRAGKLNLVDLAGSERQKKTGASGAQLKEGSRINLSLSALGNVISALADAKGPKNHIPYRDSKLTRLLQDSLGGNTKTLMIAAISPADKNYDETLSTLRYANRAKNITNKPKINEDPKDTMLREYKEEIEKLRQMLLAQASGGSSVAGGIPSISQDTGTTSKLIDDHTVSEKLKEKDEEIERERNLREELNARILEMQSKMYGGSGTGGAGEGEAMSVGDAEEMERKKAEQKAKALKHRERREKMKQRMRKIRQEREELRMQLQARNLASAGGEQEMNDEFVDAPFAMQQQFQQVQQFQQAEEVPSNTEKKLRRKIKHLSAEIEDLKDEARFEKFKMMELISEQAKDLKLYEQICRAILPEKDLKKAVERSQWSEDTNDWMLPALKMRDYKVGSVSEMYSNYGVSGSSVSNNRLPDIGGGGSRLPSLGDAQPFVGSLDIVGTKMLMKEGMGAPELRDSRDGNRQHSSSDRSSLESNEKQYRQYDMEDRVEYNPSLAKLTNFSTLGSAPKPTTPNREQDKKVKSARPPKIKKDPSQSSQEDQLALLARPPPTQFSTEASTQDQEYADDYENEFDDDYAGPITDWGFLIPSGESEQVIIDQNEIPSNKEKKQKKKKSKHIPKEDRDEKPKLSLPPI